jgi:hypothetical protein
VSSALGGMARLEVLCLDAAEVGDGVARGCARLPRLRRLDLYGSQLTDQGVAALVSAFLAWIRLPCLRHCVHGASIRHCVHGAPTGGGAAGGGGGGGGGAECRRSSG